MSDIAIDADVLMNLIASAEASNMLTIAQLRALVCPEVERETLYLEDAGGTRSAIDLTQLFADGSAVRLSLTQSEIEQFVRLAAEVDDGEAQALAVAVTRGVSMATDDRRALRVAASLGVKTIETPSLVLGWAATVAPPLAGLALTRIERRARFAPRQDHPLRAQWNRLRDTT